MHNVPQRKEVSSYLETIKRKKNSTGGRSRCQQKPSWEDDVLLHRAGDLERKEPACQVPHPTSLISATAPSTRAGKPVSDPAFF